MQEGCFEAAEKERPEEGGMVPQEWVRMCPGAAGWS